MEFTWLHRRGDLFHQLLPYARAEVLLLLLSSSFLGTRIYSAFRGSTKIQVMMLTTVLLSSSFTLHFITQQKSQIYRIFCFPVGLKTWTMTKSHKAASYSIFKKSFFTGKRGGGWEAKSGLLCSSRWMTSTRLGSSPHQNIQSSLQSGLTSRRHTHSRLACRQRMKLSRMGSSWAGAEMMGPQSPWPSKLYLRHLMPVSSAYGKQKGRKESLDHFII